VVRLSPRSERMMSASEELFNGAFLGDVVESLTGHDVLIRRTRSRRFPVTGSAVVRSSYVSRAYSGRTLLGTAEVTWEGAPGAWLRIRNARMKEHLKKHRVRATNESYDPSRQVLHRRFRLKSKAGILEIRETLFLRRVQLLARHAEKALI
jgi:hypothetical protein